MERMSCKLSVRRSDTFSGVHLARGNMADGMRAAQATKALRPPLMFKVADGFRFQLGLWSEAQLARAFEILTQAETDCKTTGLPAEAVTGRALLAIAQAARAGKRPSGTQQYRR